MISAIVLAAGLSRRMGQPKLLLDWGGRSLVAAVADAALASKADEVIVVLGANGGEIRASVERGLAGKPLRFVYNPRFALGQSTSLIAGVAALDKSSTGALVLLGDQPLITGPVLDQLVYRFRRGDVPLVYPTYGTRRGTPVLFGRALFPELLALSGDQGGRDVVRRHLAEGGSVAIEDMRASQDVDTWDDYLSLCI